MKKVAILGAGFVSEPLARYLMDECAYDVVMATRTPSKAEKIIGDRKNGRAVAWVAEQHDEIVVEFGDRTERRLSTMHVEGDPNGSSAMSRAVSLPAAIATRLILEGELNLTGVQMPLRSEIYEPVLQSLGKLGFNFRHQTIPV